MYHTLHKYFKIPFLFPYALNPTLTRSAMKIIVYASELAACIGENKFQTVSDTKLKVWMRSSPETYSLAQLRNLVVSKAPIEEIIKKHGVEDTFVELCNAKNEFDAAKTGLPGVKSFVDTLQLDETTKKDLVSAIFTERGKRGEDAIVNSAEKVLGTVGKRNDTFYKKYFKIPGSDSELMLGGRVDGFRNDELFEVKNRQYRLFDMIPVYELIQITSYMHLTGARKCQFVQNYRDNNRVSELNWEQERWDSIQEKMLAFGKEVVDLIEDTEQQDVIMTSGMDVWKK